MTKNYGVTLDEDAKVKDNEEGEEDEYGDHDEGLEIEDSDISDSKFNDFTLDAVHV